MSLRRYSVYLAFRDGWAQVPDGWAQIIDDWAQACSSPPLATPLFGGHALCHLHVASRLVNVVREAD